MEIFQDPSSLIQDPSSLIFIDPTVPNHQSLVANVSAGAEAIVLDPSRNGVAQISEILADHSDISDLHIVSHGGPGSLQLGTAELSRNNLENYAPALQGWANALTDKADILLYGCKVAAGESGHAFVQELSHLTGADIAASTDLTGSSDLGGDWDFEVATGAIETGLAFQPQIKETYNAVFKEQLAFPTAEGFGAKAEGGRGGEVLFVTNLKDSGTGSLRAALEANGRRTVVFKVGGTIKLKKSIEIKNPYITIAGQTAPGGGITITSDGSLANGTISNVIAIKTHDVIVRHLRVRPAPKGSKAINAINVTSNAHDVILDHVSASWGSKGQIPIWNKPSNVTVQNSIIAEGLNLFLDVFGGPHSKGSLTGKGADKITFYRNLFAHNLDRNPWVKTDTPADATYQIVNNVIYNWERQGTSMGGVEKGGTTKVNLIGNYYKAGPNSPESGYREVTVFKDPDQKTLVYVKGNIGPNRPNNSMDEWAIVGQNEPGNRWVQAPKSFQAKNPFNAPAIPTLSAQNAYNAVLNGAGATKPGRDAVDRRIVNDVIKGTGKIIKSPSEVGGWPNLAKGTPPVDRDKDGMPDAWEKQHGFNPNNANDRNGDADNDGYTNLEEYLNELAGDQSGGGNSGAGSSGAGSSGAGNSGGGNSGGGSTGGGSTGGGGKQSPFGGKPQVIKNGAYIEAENFDTGGKGVAYFDRDSSNKGGQYRRSEGVDIEKAKNAGSGYNVGWLKNGEWLEYTTNVTKGKYDIQVHVASSNPNPGKLRLELDGKPLGIFDVKKTGGWQKWKTLTFKGVNLSGGKGKILRLEVEGGNYNLDWLKFK